MLDRTIAPPTRTIDYLYFPWPEVYQIKEGLPAFVLNARSQPVVKLELICDAGSWYEPHNGIAYFTAKMLQEGSQQKSAQDLADYIDQYGASIQIQIRPDTCSVVLATLSKHLKPMLALLVELLLTPTFSEQRLEYLKHLRVQSLKIAASKNSYLAHNKFKELLFCSEHPYGRQLTNKAIETITTGHLKQYHQNQLFANCRLLISGQVREEDLLIIRNQLQPLPIQTPTSTLPPQSTQVASQVHLKKEESLQASIRMGRTLCTKDHPDYLPLLVFNELLGGYFGSRLMHNIREEKGYTYGISSRIVPLKHTSYLLIATEVIQAYTQATCQEIEREIRTLQTVPVPREELTMLQNYMLGSFLSEVNDPFSIMEKFKAAYLHGLDQTYYEQLHETIRCINAPQIIELANKYLSHNNLSQVIVG